MSEMGSFELFPEESPGEFVDTPDQVERNDYVPGPLNPNADVQALNPDGTYDF